MKEKSFDIDSILVSVIIPTYNRRNTIERAVESVLKQTHSNLEIIIVDDGSSDGSIDILRGLEEKENKVKVLLQEHKGANAARNLGIKNSKGQVIAFQDSDDVWLPDKLERQLLYMVDHDYDVCYSPFFLFQSGHMEIIPENYEDKQVYEMNLIKILRHHNVISTQTLVVAREVILDVGVFDEEMPRYQDYEYVIRIIQKMKIGYVNEPLVKVYRTENSISNDSEKEKIAEKKLLMKHTDFFDLEACLRERLNRDIESLDSIQFAGKIEDLNDFMKRNMDTCPVNVYKVANELLVYKYKLWKDSHIKEYEKRIGQLYSYGFAIYGAGVIGKKIYHELKEKKLTPQCFIVTDKQQCDELYGVPVFSLEEWDDNEKAIIIGVSVELQDTLIDNLIQKGFINYFRYPYGI